LSIALIIEPRADADSHRRRRSEENSRFYAEHATPEKSGYRRPAADGLSFRLPDAAATLAPPAIIHGIETSDITTRRPPTPPPPLHQPPSLSPPLSFSRCFAFICLPLLPHRRSYSSVAADYAISRFRHASSRVIALREALMPVAACRR